MHAHARELRASLGLVTCHTHSAGLVLFHIVLPLAAQTAAIAKGRESWLYFSVPEKPVAGAPVVIYFNRSQSEPLQ